MYSHVEAPTVNRSLQLGNEYGRRYCLRMAWMALLAMVSILRLLRPRYSGIIRSPIHAGNHSHEDIGFVAMEARIGWEPVRRCSQRIRLDMGIRL